MGKWLNPVLVPSFGRGIFSTCTTEASSVGRIARFSKNPGTCQGEIECTASFIVFLNSSAFHVLQASHIIFRVYLLHCGPTDVGRGGGAYSLELRELRWAFFPCGLYIMWNKKTCKLSRHRYCLTLNFGDNANHSHSDRCQPLTDCKARETQRSLRVWGCRITKIQAQLFTGCKHSNVYV